MADRANKSSKNGYKAFTSIAYAIPKCTSAEDVATLFGVLGGQLPLEKAAEILPGCKAITSYIPEHKAANWGVCHGWTQWWLREKHLIAILEGRYTCAEITPENTVKTVVQKNCLLQERIAYKLSI